jgi:hypothetical protein
MRFLLDFIVIRSFEFLNQPVKKKNGYLIQLTIIKAFKTQRAQPFATHFSAIFLVFFSQKVVPGMALR